MLGTPAKFDITFRRGTENEFKLYYFDDTGEVDLSTLWDGARMQIRTLPINEPPPAPAPLFELTTTNGRLTFEDGGIKIKVTSNEVSSFTFNKGVYDLELYSGTGLSEIVCTLLEGNIKVKGEVTV